VSDLFSVRSTPLTDLADLATSFPMQSPTSPTSSSPQDDAAKPANGASISGAPAWWNNPPPRKKKTASSKKQRKQNASPAVAAKDAADDGDAASSVPIETPEPFSSQEALCQPKFDLTVPTVIAKAPAWTSADLEDAQDDNLDRRCGVSDSFRCSWGDSSVPAVG